MRAFYSAFAATCSAIVLSFTLVSAPVQGAGAKVDLDKQDWSFSGMTGTYDKNQLARGFEVFKTVCASCHSLNYVAFRDFLDIGFTEVELKAIMEEGGYEVLGEPDEEGEVDFRPTRLADYWPNPYDNAKAAAAANNGKAPPDLSLMAKARVGGADYIYNLLTRYVEANDAKLKELKIEAFDSDSQYLNEVYPGYIIAMAQPINGDEVEYLDGTPTSVEQMSKDVSAFLVWTAEPKMEVRKAMGIKVLIFLAVFSLLGYLMHRRLGHRAMARQEQEGGPW